MCELFGISASQPVYLRYSLHTFAEHGGLIHPNKSGWGIAHHVGRDAIILKEPAPAAESPWVRFAAEHPVLSSCVISHVRYATAGAPTYSNTHPFARELGGRVHFFAHNGSLKDIWDRLSLKTTRFLPIGETDSEYAFCYLLENIAPLWESGNPPPSRDARMAVVADTAQKLRRLGPINFLYSDGLTLFAHGHRRAWDEGGGRFSAPRPPGLSIALRRELSVKGLEVQRPTEEVDIVCVASVPLDDEDWSPLPEGTLVALEDGCEVDRKNLEI